MPKYGCIFDTLNHLRFISNKVIKFRVPRMPIKAWRTYKKISQKQMAQRMNIFQPAYSQIESNSNPQDATTARVADALQVTIEQLTS